MELGARVRALRQRANKTQVSLAEDLEISPSYLNLIEHGRRPLPAHLLIKVARVFDLDLASFGADDTDVATTEVAEVFADPVLANLGVSDAEIAEFASRSPVMARALLTLYEGYRDSRESIESLASRMSAGQDVPGVEPWRLPSEEVSEFLQRNGNYFPELEVAAESLWNDAALDPHDIYSGLRDHVYKALGVSVQVKSADGDARTVRRFDPALNVLELSELLPPHTVVFQIAHQFGLLAHADLLDRLTDDKRLTTPDSRALARVALANYFAGAVMMPYERFIEAATSLRYDIDILGRRFRASFEQVCHRLTTLRRPGREGVAFHFIRVDIAGNISKRFSASGIAFARFSGACPRWNLVNCFLTPGQLRVQLSQMPDGREYFCVARTVSRGEHGFGSPPAVHAICLGCSADDAAKLIYSDGVELDNRDAAVPVGVTCRLCERMDCEQRAFPPLQRTLQIDENVRAHSFYASLKD